MIVVNKYPVIPLHGNTRFRNGIMEIQKTYVFNSVGFLLNSAFQKIQMV